MFLCRGCCRYLHSADFSPSASARLISRCRDCSGLDNVARSRNELSCYRNILWRLRADEQQLTKESRIPFLLQVICASWTPRLFFFFPDQSDVYLCVLSGGGHAIPGGGVLGIALGSPRQQRPLRLGVCPLGASERLEPLELYSAVQGGGYSSP